MGFPLARSGPPRHVHHVNANRCGSSWFEPHHDFGSDLSAKKDSVAWCGFDMSSGAQTKTGSTLNGVENEFNKKFDLSN